jgi:MoxR-like ATPase
MATTDMGKTDIATDIMALNATIAQENQVTQRLMTEINKVVVGQREMVEGILMGLMTGGHILLEGVPGLAKTLTISTVANAISLHFQRIQFTPDLLPTDLIGTMIFNPKTAEFTPRKGPVFANIVLADEINRAPAKVQSALLESMAEKQVTIGETSYPLPNPFLVLATQNPLEQEGTYSLPEAQMDRFLFKINVSYPNKVDEMEILNRMGINSKPTVQPVWSLEDLARITKLVDQIYVDQKIKNYVVDIVMATRNPKEYGLSRVAHFIQVGGSPRATLSMFRAAKAHAFLRSRGYVTTDDVKAVIFNVLRHRLILTFEADAENVSSDQLVKEILSEVEVS